MSDNVQNKKIGASPFGGNVISMKDVKDKTTRKGSLRPLFDCVDSFSASVDSMHQFLESNPEDTDKELITTFLKHLTDMQIKLLEMCQQKVQQQNRFDPLAAPVEEAAPAAPEAQPAPEPVKPAAEMKPVAKR